MTTPGRRALTTSVVTNASGVKVGTQGYYPFGETRYTTGTLYTDKLYTGQQQIAGLGLYNYKARLYDPALGKFVSPDSVTPGGPQGLNRYSYTFNNPIRYTDPSGHMPTNDECGLLGCETWGSGGSIGGGNGGTGSGGNGGGNAPQLPANPTLGNNGSDNGCSTDDLNCELGAKNYKVNDYASLNPPVIPLVIIGVLLHLTTVVTEIGIIKAEILLSGGSLFVPELTVPLEIILGAVGIAALDFDVSYWVYVYRVYGNPDVHQNLKLFPPWGL